MLDYVNASCFIALSFASPSGTHFYEVIKVFSHRLQSEPRFVHQRVILNFYPKITKLNHLELDYLQLRPLDGLCTPLI